MRFKFLLILFLPLCANAQARFEHITNYTIYYGWAHRVPQDWAILRRFESRGKTYLVLVNPQTLQTKIDEPASIRLNS